MSETKKVYFYKVKIEKLVFKNEINKRQKEKVEMQEMITVFSDLFSKVSADEGVICSLDNDPAKTTAEFFNNADSEKDIFGRIGKEEDINYLRVRNNKDRKGEELVLEDDTYPEKCTYFYYNLETGILSYISLGGAPKYKKFERILAQILKDNKFSVSITAIANLDAAKSIQKNSKLNSLKVRIAVPRDDFLGCENLGLSKSDFISAKDLDYFTIELTMHGKRRKGVSDDKQGSEFLVKLFNKVRQNARGNLRYGKIKGSNPGERTREFDLFEELVTNQVELPTVQLQDLFIEEIKAALLNAYNQKEDEILSLSRK